MTEKHVRIGDGAKPMAIEKPFEHVKVGLVKFGSSDPILRVCRLDIHRHYWQEESPYVEEVDEEADDDDDDDDGEDIDEDQEIWERDCARDEQRRFDQALGVVASMTQKARKRRLREERRAAAVKDRRAKENERAERQRAEAAAAAASERAAKANLAKENERAERQCAEAAAAAASERAAKANLAQEKELAERQRAEAARVEATRVEEVELEVLHRAAAVLMEEGGLMEEADSMRMQSLPQPIMGASQIAQRLEQQERDVAYLKTAITGIYATMQTMRPQVTQNAPVSTQDPPESGEQGTSRGGDSHSEVGPSGVHVRKGHWRDGQLEKELEEKLKRVTAGLTAEEKKVPGRGRPKNPPMSEEEQNRRKLENSRKRKARNEEKKAAKEKESQDELAKKKRRGGNGADPTSMRTEQETRDALGVISGTIYEQLSDISDDDQA